MANLKKFEQEEFEGEIHWGTKRIYPSFVVKGVANTAGVGIANYPLMSYHCALSSAGIDCYNIVPVSSVLPKRVEIKELDKYADIISPAGILFTIESKLIIEPQQIKKRSLAFAALTISEMHKYKLALEFHDIVDFDYKPRDYDEFVKQIVSVFKDYVRQKQIPRVSIKGYMTCGIFYIGTSSLFIQVNFDEKNITHKPLNAHGNYFGNDYITLINEFILRVETVF